MEKLTVKNFGPIKSASIVLRDVNVFIGPTSSGKSTLAKLVSIFKDPEFFEEFGEAAIVQQLAHYNIDFGFAPDTVIEFQSGPFRWIYEQGVASTNFPLTNSLAFVASATETVNAILLKDKDSVSLIKALVFVLGVQEALENDLKSNFSNRKILADPKTEKFVSRLQESIPSSANLLSGDGIDSLVTVASDIVNFFLDCNLLRTVLYTPAERVLISSLSDAMYGILKNDVNLPTCVKDFGTAFETARANISEFSVPFLGTKYEYSEKSNYLIVDKQHIRLAEAASGLQSVIPMLLVLEDQISSQQRLVITLEEPELNLYPLAQKKLVEHIAERIIPSKSKLIVTTHSPYILSAFDNLIQAHNTATEKPEQAAEIAKVVPKKRWLPFDAVSSYYVANGRVKDIRDKEFKMIGANKIDDVSDTIAADLDALLDIRYADEK